MSSDPSEFSSDAPPMPSAANYARLCNDLTVVMVTLELVASHEDLPADLRPLVEAANRRLLGTVQWLKGDEAGGPSAATVPTRH